MGRASRISDRIRAPLIFVGSGLSQYSGAVIATVWLVAVMTPPAVAWWRVAVAAVILALIRRANIPCRASGATPFEPRYIFAVSMLNAGDK